MRAEAAGARQKFVFFWKERATPAAGLGPGCLSQFWPAPFVVDGVTYATAEHWMMVQKARLFDDQEAADRALAARTAQAAKAAGRMVRGFAEGRWAAARYEIVVAGNMAKSPSTTGSVAIYCQRETGCWLRRVRSIGSGGSAWPKTTTEPRPPRSGGA